MTYLVILFLIILNAISYLPYSRMGSFLFAGGSDSTLQLITPPFIMLSIVNFGFIIAFLYTLHFRPSFGLITVITLLMTIWLLCGRVIGVFHDGRIISGYFFIPVKTIDFRDVSEDFENYITETEIRRSSNLIIEIKNGRSKESIFIGPVNINACNNLLKSIGFKTDQS